MECIKNYNLFSLSLYCVAFLLTLIIFYNFFSKSWRCARIYRENARRNEAAGNVVGGNIVGGNVAYVYPEPLARPYWPAFWYFFIITHFYIEKLLLYINFY